MKRRRFCMVLVCCVILMSLGCASPKAQLYTAVTKGDGTRVKRILEKNPELEVDAHTFNLAAEVGDLECVKLLVERGADVNAQESVRVADRENSSVVEYPSGGATYNIHFRYVPDASRPAVAYAITNHHVEVVEYLIEHGASVLLRFIVFDPDDDWGFEPRWVTIQQLAQESGDNEIIRLVTENDPGSNALPR